MRLVTVVGLMSGLGSGKVARVGMDQSLQLLSKELGVSVQELYRIAGEVASQYKFTNATELWNLKGKVSPSLIVQMIREKAGKLKVTRVGVEGVIKSDELTFSADKILPQMGVRGWTVTTIKNLVKDPYTVRGAKNKANGNLATVFYGKDGTYVSVDNVTKEVIQVTDNNVVRGLIPGKTWYPDDSIINPYKP